MLCAVLQQLWLRGTEVGSCPVGSVAGYLAEESVSHSLKRHVTCRTRKSCVGPGGEGSKLDFDLSQAGWKVEAKDLRTRLQMALDVLTRGRRAWNLFRTAEHVRVVALSLSHWGVIGAFKSGEHNGQCFGSGR